MNLSAGLIRKLEDIDPKMKDVFLCFMEEVDEKTRIISVGRSDFDELKDVVRQIAEAQNRTEHRLEELAEAQKQTEISVNALSVGMKDLRSQVGGLSMTVGYGIEDRLMPYLHRFALQEFGIEVTLVDRRNIVYPDGKYDEVYLYIEGKKNSLTVFLIGESKTQPGKKDFDRFAKRIERLQSVLKGQITALMVGYHYTPEVEAYASRLYPNILRYKTFQITMMA